MECGMENLYGYGMMGFSGFGVLVGIIFLLLILTLVLLIKESGR